MHLQDLSVEVLTSALDCLAARDLLACRQVSRYLLEVIDRSECLQYNTDLAIASMMDGPSSALCTAERRSMLREHQNAWGSVQLSVQSTLYIPPVFHRVPTPHRIFGNVLLEHAPGGLRCTQLPSRIRGMEEKRWSIDCVAIAPGFVIDKFALDPAQDLLVLLECRYNRVPIHIHAQSYRNQTHYRAQIRVLSMFDGTTHPAAVSTFLCKEEFIHVEWRSELRIHGDAVGWLVFQKMSLKLARPSIQVWNWKTGDLVWDLSARHSFLHLDPRTFSFLDENHMIVMYKRRLAVYGFDTRATTTTKATSEDFVVSLDVPIRADREVDRIIIFPRAGSSARSHSRPDTPFQSSPSDSLYVIQIDFSVDSMDDIFWYLFVPAPTIRACVARARKDSKARDLTWQAWGIQGARIMRRMHNNEDWYAFDVQGTRTMAATWPHNNRDMTRIHVLEFGPMVRHHMQTCMLRGDTVDVDDGCEEGKATYVTTEYRVDGAEAFFTDVTTQLPFRTSWRDVAQSAYDVSRLILLYEDGVMIQRRDTGWQLHSL